MIKIKNLFLLLCLFLLFSCGLDVYFFLEAPINSSDIKNPLDNSQQFFSFTTNDSFNTDVSLVGNVNFLGTQVYYKIYNDLETLKNQKIVIDDSNNSDLGFTRLNFYDFQKLSCSVYSDPLIKQSNTLSNQNVRIRLKDDVVESAGIYIDGIKKGLPCRFDQSSFQNNEGEAFSGIDVNESSTGDGSYYILMYAVSVGSVNLSQRIYSSILSLGYLEL